MLTSSSILLVDDCSSRREQIRDQLSDKVGEVVSCPPPLEDPEDLFQTSHFISTVAVNIAPLEMYPTSFVRSVHHRWPWVSILLFNGPSSAQLAVATLKAGASDYLPGDCTATDVAEATETDLRRRPSIQPREPAVLGTANEGKFIGNAESMQPVLERFGRATDTSLSVLLLGEPGTGKTFAAQAIHAESTRSGAPFLLVDCRCAKPEDLRGLFLGHRLSEVPDTAFTLRDLKGGTVVLDHIDEMDGEAQDIVAHALEVQDFASGGGSQEEFERGVRFIGVTSSPSPPKEFRTDLYYRLGELPISLPPLRDRVDDILPLARHFLTLYAGSGHNTEPTFTAEAESALRNYSWPGNVRQLENVVNRAVRATPDATTRREDLLLPEGPCHPDQRAESASQAVNTPSQGTPAPPVANHEAQTPDLKEDAPSGSTGLDSGSIAFEDEESACIPSMEELKKQAVERAYERFDGDVDRASVALDIGRSTMYRMLKRYDLRECGD